MRNAQASPSGFYRQRKGVDEHKGSIGLLDFVNRASLLPGVALPRG